MTTEISGNLKRILRADRRRGAILTLIAVSMPVVLFVIAFAVDVSYLRMARNELRVAADASARVGVHTLATTGDKPLAAREAKDFAAKNDVAGKELILDAQDVEFGRADYNERKQEWDFQPDSDDPNAVRVTSRRTSDSPSGPIDTFFSGTFGFLQADLETSAVGVVIEPELALVVDRSDSMAVLELTGLLLPGWQFCTPALPTARFTLTNLQLLGLFLRLGATPHDEKVSLVTFADTGAIDSPLTTNYVRLIAALQARILNFCGGARNISDGLSNGIQSLQSNSPLSYLTDKHILLITDGGDASSSLINLASQAQAQGIAVHTVSYGPKADRSFLQRVAAAGGGTHWHVDRMTQFRTVIQELVPMLKPNYTIIR